VQRGSDGLGIEVESGNSVLKRLFTNSSRNAPLNPPVLYPVGLERWLAALFLFSDLGLNLEDIRGLGAGIP